MDRRPGDYSPWGHKEVRYDLPTATSEYIVNSYHSIIRQTAQLKVEKYLNRYFTKEDTEMVG